ncbi:variable surface lipoprotein [Mycoplasmopsis lipofaciens]|uniref:variable surface lipoprotein n=1 Tax=Mycoplasmopsis lipofaciens TaxID=114884 RepID=UPI0004898BDA|nr:variable surface lipoprotein [Mycoplasmopsis lipofaciens]
MWKKKILFLGSVLPASLPLITISCDNSSKIEKLNNSLNNFINEIPKTWKLDDFFNKYKTRSNNNFVNFNDKNELNKWIEDYLNPNKTFVFPGDFEWLFYPRITKFPDLQQVGTYEWYLDKIKYFEKPENKNELSKFTLIISKLFFKHFTKEQIKETWDVYHTNKNNKNFSPPKPLLTIDVITNAKSDYMGIWKYDFKPYLITKPDGTKIIKNAVMFVKIPGYTFETYKRLDEKVFNFDLII